MMGELNFSIVFFMHQLIGDRRGKLHDKKKGKARVAVKRPCAGNALAHMYAECGAVWSAVLGMLSRIL